MNMAASAPPASTMAGKANDQRHQLLQKILQQAMQRRMQTAGRAGAVGANPHGAAGAAAMVHGLSIANFLKSKLGVGGDFAAQSQASNFAPADAPSPFAPTADQAAQEAVSGTPVGGPAPAPPQGVSSPATADTAPHTTPSDPAFGGGIPTMWADESNNTPGGLVSLGNGIWFDPTTGQIVGNGAPAAGSGVMGRGAVSS
jgi:hypothetical protein